MKNGCSFGNDFIHFHRFLGHAILNVFVGMVWLEVLELPRCHITSRRTRTRQWGIHVEAMLQRTVRLGTEMPFSKCPVA